MILISPWNNKNVSQDEFIGALTIEHNQQLTLAEMQRMRKTELGAQGIEHFLMGTLDCIP